MSKLELIVSADNVKELIEKINNVLGVELYIVKADSRPAAKVEAPKKVEEPKVEKEPVKVEEPKVEEPAPVVAEAPVNKQAMYTLEDVQKVCVPLMDANRIDELAGILNSEFGVTAITMLPQESYGAFIDRVKAL